MEHTSPIEDDMKDASLPDGTLVVDTIYMVEQFVEALPPNALQDVKITPIYFKEQGWEYRVGFVAYKVAGDKRSGTLVYVPGVGSYYPMKEALQRAYLAYWDMVENMVIVVPVTPYVTPDFDRDTPPISPALLPGGWPGALTADNGEE